MLFETSSTSSSSPSPGTSTTGMAMAAAAAAAAAAYHQQHHQQQQQQPQTSSRILYDIPCKVCTDHSSGKHYGIFACDGCAGFFKRSIRRNRQYVCKAKSEGACLVDKTHRNQCRACRLKRCLAVGMNKEAVQHERGPRNSTLRRQMSLYFKEHQSVSPPPTSSTLAPTSTSSSPILASPKPILPMIHHTSPPPPPPPPFFVDPRILAAAAASSVVTPAAAAAAANISTTTTSTPSSFFHHLPAAISSASSTANLVTPTPKYPQETLSLPPPPPAPSSDALSEAAARLLFMNVRWAQNVPAFVQLPYKDQMSLLEETWRELFVLSAAQFALPVEAAAAAAAAENDLTSLTELKAFQDAIGRFVSMRVDATEFACLRAVILLKTSLEDCGELRDQATVNVLQDQAQLTLSQYVSKAYPLQPQRFGKLLLLLPSLKAVSGKTIHSLFFKCIGQIPLEKLICDMFKARGV